jgi:hypothetical protein
VLAAYVNGAESVPGVNATDACRLTRLRQLQLKSLRPEPAQRTLALIARFLPSLHSLHLDYLRVTDETFAKIASHALCLRKLHLQHSTGCTAKLLLESGKKDYPYLSLFLSLDNKGFIIDLQQRFHGKRHNILIVLKRCSRTD